MSSHMDTIPKRKESLKHFSHDHPLIYVEEENSKANCSACGVALVSSPSYTCSQGCNFFLHRPCTELLQSTKLKFGGLWYDLILLVKTSHDNCKCEKCGNLCKNFTYKCYSLETSYPYHDFYLHCQCAFSLEIIIKHISHHEHALMAMCKEASLVCDACGRKQDGIFFSCQNCSFYIHHDCCSLPSIIHIKHHRHPLFILYSLRSFKFWYSMKCLFCNDEVSLTLGAYVCGWCSGVAHIHCAASAVENTEIVQASIHLPSMPDTFSSLITRAYLENREDDAIDQDVKSKIEEYHTDHSSWTFHHRERDDFQLVCNACILPIISSHPSFYSCPQPQCFFLLHESCANLPPLIKNFYRTEPIHLFSKSSRFCSIFSCDRCHKDCNGFVYQEWVVSIDVQCATSPNTIKHESHNQHLLILSTYTKNFCCCDRDSFDTSYSCGICDHHIHPNCAFLPKTVEHKFDEHPLDLIYNLTVQIPRDDEEEEKEHHYLCEFCEEDINPKFWFYYCCKCDQAFHVNCIPSTGKLSKIKFGFNIDLPRHVHDHPVTLTRMLTMGSQRCGHCKDTIQGFVDDMAFHCSNCDFWIHFECAREVFLSK